MATDVTKINQTIFNLKQYWYQRNLKFRSWYELLILIDLLESKGMETYVSNEPQTFYNMAHYLLTTGELSHIMPIEDESALELDKRAKVGRGCEYLWKSIDRERQLGGSQPFVDDLSFFLLILGWHSEVMQFDHNTGLLKVQLWNPHDVYPGYINNHLYECVHSYKILEEEVEIKAQENNWSYISKGTPTGEVTLDDFFHYDKGNLYNIILINGQDVTGWQERPDMQVLVSPVGGFPDKGSLTLKSGSKSTGKSSAIRDWRRFTGRGIFEVNEAVWSSFNKWKSMVSQILRDTAQPITQEFSATPRATTEQLRERGAHFHYSPGEQGLQRVPPPVIPLEIQAFLQDSRRELQKGSFSDIVHGIVEGGASSQAGYGLSLLASSSANQILYPYMDAKHFVVGECDRFWLSKLKQSSKIFQIKGKFLEKLESKDIPEDVIVEVESDVATPKDWLQRGTIANMLKDHLDEATIVTEILKMRDPQAIKRRRSLDRILEHPMSQMVEMIAGYYAHAEYLDKIGDRRQAALFRRAAKSLEAQLGVPPPGQGAPTDMGRIQAERTAGAPVERTRVQPGVSPPEEGGFTPMDLRRSIGRGTVRTAGGR